MKGVILAGGGGTRLFPNTKVTNKHLLPVYNQPMIYYPIQTLLKAGIKDILIMPGKDNAGDFAKLLGSGKEFGANFVFKVQDHNGGLAYAAGLARQFAAGDDFVLILGDNLLEDNIIEDVENFKGGAKIFLKQVDDPHRFGVADVEGDRVISIEEKPKNPKSNWAAIGVYIYDKNAFEYIDTLKPSERGELEITDLNNVYLQKGQLTAGFVKGFWFDAGTHESLVDAAYTLKNLARPIEPMERAKTKMPKVIAGAILYDNDPYSTQKYLKPFIDSFLAQDYSNLELIFIDNSSEQNSPSTKFVRENYPQIDVIEARENLGFAKANNLMIKRAIEKDAEYFLATNVDIMYDARAVSEMVNVLIKDPRAASVAPKVKMWDFADYETRSKGKTNFLDTTGIIATTEHHFYDRGQGETDNGQYDIEEYVFGASGASALYRISALRDTAFVETNGREEYFDELMFMYKEDVDLAYRLNLAGYKCVYTPTALVFHDRSVRSFGDGIFDTIKSRRQRKKHYKEWAWLNHHIILQKIADDISGVSKIKTLFYELKTAIYLLFFEPYVLKQVWSLWKMRDQIRMKREQIKRRVKLKHVERG